MTTSDVARAAKLSRVPGVTIAEACARFGVAKSAVTRARRDPASHPSIAELALAALTRNGADLRGRLDLEGIARWIDYVNHDACTSAEVRGLLESFVATGQLSIDADQWSLQVPWP